LFQNKAKEQMKQNEADIDNMLGGGAVAFLSFGFRSSNMASASTVDEAVVSFSSSDSCSSSNNSYWNHQISTPKTQIVLSKSRQANSS
jgi:hypothetical protein